MSEQKNELLELIENYRKINNEVLELQKILDDCEKSFGYNIFAEERQKLNEIIELRANFEKKIQGIQNVV